METLDDAGVYRISGEIALIQTIDFFTPIVDDAYAFGQIAAANALSDIYAMGGRPITALNLLCFPMERLAISVLEEVLRGGIDKINEAGVALLGGHSVDDDELKYGLAVTGTVHPDRLVTNGGAAIGDRLILTKRLGTGIINTAAKRKATVDADLIARVTASMATLNRTASEVMVETGANGCTDITGYALLGHAAEMAERSGVALRIDHGCVPHFPEVVGLARDGHCPGGLGRNRDYYGPRVSFAEGIPDFVRDILFDPQTSGGLLISVSADRSDDLLARLHDAGIEDSSVIGEVVAGKAGTISVQ
jgi:selenide,water dikinase